MKELYEEQKKLNQEIGGKQAEIKIQIEEYGEELAKTTIEILKEQIKEREEKLQILRNAEMILLGIDYKKYQNKEDQ